jgi:hypothetical protein
LIYIYGRYIQHPTLRPLERPNCTLHQPAHPGC